MADTSSSGRIKVSPPNSIYTVLVIVATLFVIMGTVILAYQSHELFGVWIPPEELVSAM